MDNEKDRNEDILESKGAPDQSGQSDQTDPEETELDQVRAELEEYKDRYMRSVADLENYRRRVEKEKSDLLNYGLEGFLKELLPVLDSLDKAIEDREDEKKESFLDGVEMVRKQLLTVLSKSGLETIEASGAKFDPNLHQAIQKVEKEEIDEEMIDQEFAKGYLLNGRLLRPSMVTVAVPKDS